ncbi:DNA repair protein rad2 [Rhizina undulata]
MGVQGLWTIVAPCARPIKLETLSRKRLAIDASVWIYQFLKAVRDKEGNALRNSHVVGFFRRICKLLFFGIRPVFVFDGGAPILKRQTIAGRKKRREGKREDAVKTAGRLLAVQMQRRAEEEREKEKERNRRRKEKGVDRADEPEEELPREEDMVYVDELMQTTKERRANAEFKKQDPYHLPDLDDSLENLVAPNDPRIMSQEELQEYARQFRGGESMNLYDFSKIDFESAFFLSLPPADRYNILNAARTRSRLRMGLSKEQLDKMFPDRLAFSKFQIERVKERADLTRRLMNINGMNDAAGSIDISRVAGERGREYVLVRNDGVEGGWALGVVGSKEEAEGARNKPIVVDKVEKEEEVDEDEDDDDEFEDVPIEGLNRLPVLENNLPGEDPDAPWDNAEAQMMRQALYESRVEQSGSRRGSRSNSKAHASTRENTIPLFMDDKIEEEDELLLPDPSLAKPDDNEDEDLQKAIEISMAESRRPESEDEDEQLRRAIELSKQNGKILDKGKQKALPGQEKATSSISNKTTLSSQLTAASKLQPPPPPIKSYEPPKPSFPPNLFGGLLPFELLDLRKSATMLTKKKPEDKSEESKDADAEDKSTPLPPWFVTTANRDLKTEIEKAHKDVQAREREEQRKRDEGERKKRDHEVLMIESDGNDSDLEIIDVAKGTGKDVKAMPSKTISRGAGFQSIGDVAESRKEGELLNTAIEVGLDISQSRDAITAKNMLSITGGQADTDKKIGSDKEFEWEDSDNDEARAARNIPPIAPIISKSPTEAVSVEVQEQLEDNLPVANDQSPAAESSNDLFRDVTPPFDDSDDDINYISDPEEDQLLQQLAAESHEHARFAAELNNKTADQTAADFEAELRSLRNQQRRDRRDADDVTQTMVRECQRLLTLFGLPYITAPMEAEAQCAELVRLGLVDGIVTDDSDVFLFGGTRVYKNMFSQSKFVECYLATDMEKELALDRRKLISVAQLLGSDYTEGLPGVGPVTAMELIAEFGGLAEFREWWEKVQEDVQKGGDGSGLDEGIKKNATKIFLPSAFPDSRVNDAYTHPEVDSDPQEFTWGVPDLDALRTFLMETIGWSQERTDEVLLPVIRDMNRKLAEGTQSNITGFLSGGVGAGAFAPRRVVGKGSRMEKAVGMLRRRRGEEVEIEEEGQGGTKKRGKRKAKESEDVEADDDGEKGVASDRAQQKKRKRAAPKTRKGKRKAANMENDDKYEEAEMINEDDDNGEKNEKIPRRTKRRAPEKNAPARKRGKKVTNVENEGENEEVSNENDDNGDEDEIIPKSTKRKIARKAPVRKAPAKMKK